MKSLSEHNNALQQPKDALGARRKQAGVACDSCGTEMEYVSEQLFTSHPPKRKVACPSCGVQGYMVVLSDDK